MMDQSLQWKENYYDKNTNLFFHMQGIESGGGVFISFVPYLGDPLDPDTGYSGSGGYFPHTIEASAGVTAQSRLQPLLSTPLLNIIY